MPSRKPPAALTTQRGVDRRRRRAASQSASTSSGEVRSTASCDRPAGGGSAGGAPVDDDDAVAAGEQRRDDRRAERAAAAADERDVGHPLSACGGRGLRPGTRAAARRRVEVAAPEGRDRPRLLLDPAHLRAEVGRLEVDGDPARRDQRDEPVGDLLAEPLLDGEAAREEAHEPGQLRDADDPLAGDVGDVRRAEERQRVVLAEAVELDRALDDLARRRLGAAAALGRERGRELRGRRRSRRSRRRARAGTARACPACPACRGPCRRRRRSRPSRRGSAPSPRLRSRAAGGRTSRCARRAARVARPSRARSRCQARHSGRGRAMRAPSGRAHATRGHAARAAELERNERERAGDDDPQVGLGAVERRGRSRGRANCVERPIVRDDHQRRPVVVGEPLRPCSPPRRRRSTNQATSRSCGA